MSNTTDDKASDAMNRRLDYKQAEKERSLLENDFASPCEVCGAVVFDWWDGDTCPDCFSADGDSPDTSQQELVTDGGVDELPHPDDLPDVEEITVEGLRDEYRQRADIGYSDPDDHDRKMDLWHELRDRADVEQPECPECGEGNWGQVPGEPIRCNACGEMLGRHPELRQEIREAWGEIMYGPDDDEQLVTDGGVDVDQDGNATLREPGEGESWGPNGEIRPVPPHVPNHLEEDE